MLRAFTAKKQAAIEDFVVILQKSTQKDPSGCLAVIDATLVERLHTEISGTDNAFLQ